MEAIGRTGFAAFHFDSKNLPDESVETIGKNCRLVGNVNNPMVLYRGKSEQAYAEAIRCMNHGVMAVGPECAVPLVTPNETLQAISKACRDYPKLSDLERREWENKCYAYDPQGQIIE
jgi:[methyl-Co(III) methanol-specific corrinoid protein]:coenzyme M methyltransferase